MDTWLVTVKPFFSTTHNSYSISYNLCFPPSEAKSQRQRSYIQHLYIRWIWVTFIFVVLLRCYLNLVHVVHYTIFVPSPSLTLANNSNTSMKHLICYTKELCYSACNLRRSNRDFSLSRLVCWHSKNSPYLMPRNIIGCSSLTSREAGSTIILSDGPTTVAIDILVLWLLTSARCNTLLHLPLLTIFYHPKLIYIMRTSMNSS